MEMKWIIYVIIAIVILTIINKGWEQFKASPFKEGIDTTVDTTKSIIDIGKGIAGEGEEEGGTLVLGMIPCQSNTDCNAFEECSGTICTCDFLSGECYKEQ